MVIRRTIAGLAAGVASIALLHAQRTTAPRFVWTAYWNAPTRAAEFPEARYLNGNGTADLGIAFSGGGTRAATATLGQLRGLRANGWLEHVRYLSAVSGGGWAAVPFTYSPYGLDQLLGDSRPPGELTLDHIRVKPPIKSLGRSITDAKVLAPGALEAAEIVFSRRLSDADLPAQVESLTRKFAGGVIDRTFAEILGSAFIEPLVPNGARLYAWTNDSVADFRALNPSLSPNEFVTIPRQDAADRHRPFLIVGANLIYMHPAYEYPRLMPVEYTPIYTGIRHRFSARLGGIYVWPFAYNAAHVVSADDRVARVELDSAVPHFRLADMVASTGAAPLLTLFLKDPTGKSPLVFPTLNHFTVRDGRPSDVTPRLLHGDGGFTDNFGVMSLLARQVGNIIVFVNGTGPIEENKTVESLFIPLRERSPAADRTGNVVFDASLYERLREGIDRNTRDGSSIYCADQWDVRDNALYEIRAYKVNICWVQLQANERWFGALPADTTQRMQRSDFRRFPWLSTFGQNLPFVIRLDPEHVHLLSQFTTWMLTEPRGKRIIESSALGQVLQ
jgi:hypothetical protein